MNGIENVVMFILLRLLQSLGEIAIIESAGQIAMFSQAHTEDFIHIVVGGFYLLASCHDGCLLVLLWDRWLAREKGRRVLTGLPWRRNNAKLLQHAEIIEIVPLFGNLAIGNAQDA